MSVTVATRPKFAFDNSYVRDLPGLYVPWQPRPVAAPELLVLNQQLAVELGLDPDALRSPVGVAILAGNVVPEAAASVAQAYAGHQFGHYVPRLGDGRALLLGELIDVAGRRRDLHFKGSGRTPFARGADGRAAVGPMLREYVIGEAMHALGIPTTRALAVVGTGERVPRDTGMLPGAVLTRVAASHIRVGTFQFARAADDPALLRRLADHAIARHWPSCVEAENPYAALLSAVTAAQASLVAQWMAVGFVHGVMNTDNVTVSGETIDYGPCAFLDAFDPAAVFSSIDHSGRYAYRNQPAIMLWNLTRFAEALLPLLDDESTRAIEVARAALEPYHEAFSAHWSRLLHAKLALPVGDVADAGVVQGILDAITVARADWTGAFRALAELLRGNPGPLRSTLGEPDGIDAALSGWRGRLEAAGLAPTVAADAMDRVNPVYIPRNHLVEEALAAATGGDLQPMHRLLEAIGRPFDARADLARHAEPAPADSGPYRTFCGT